MKANFETGLKVCSRCKRELSLDNFYKCKCKSDGLSLRCKDCYKESSDSYYQKNRVKIIVKSQERRLNNKDKQRERSHLYYLNNKERLRKQHKEYYKNNREAQFIRIKNWNLKNQEYLKEYHKEYQRKNKEKISKYVLQYSKEKRRERDINFILKLNLRNRLYRVLKENRKLHHTIKYIGCSLEDLKKHLENQFVDGMSWDNYGEWHVDHIVPCASFDLSDPNQQRICFNFRNLQPLWAKDNQRKQDKLPENWLERIEGIKSFLIYDNAS